MRHPYSVKLAYKAKKGNFPAMRGEIYEHGIMIGRFSRKAVVDHYVPPIEYRFFSEASRNRFDDFANCLSIEEVIEILVPDEVVK